jgi:hypothetical protein
MKKSIAQVLFRNLGQRTIWLPLLIGSGMLFLTELFFEPVIDHYLQGSMMIALSIKLAIGLVLKPLETKIETKTLTYVKPTDSLLSEDDDNWARILMSVYRLNHFKIFQNNFSEEDGNNDNWTRTLIRVYRAKYLRPAKKE